jgi:hypothetical protein
MNVAVLGAKLWTYLPLVLLVVAILIGVRLAYGHWRDLHEDEEPLRGRDLLRDLERGDAASKMTDAELRRVRELLVGAETKRHDKPSTKPTRLDPKSAAARLRQEELAGPAESSDQDQTGTDQGNPPETEAK